MTRPSPLHLALTFSGLALAACGEDTTPTQPDTPEPQAPASLSLALASNTWTEKAALPTGATGVALGMAPNSVRQSIVYAMGGRIDGFTGFSIQASAVATNTWTRKNARVFVANLNGVGKIGNRLYFSGGYDWSSGSPAASSRLFAYDFTQDRLIPRASLPKFTADGVTGVIDGKLYVLPGTCSGDGWPAPGYCETEPIRQLYRYDPATDTWRTRKAAPHYHKSGGGAVLDGKFYVVGGFNNFAPVAHLDVYDPATNTWRTLKPIPTAGRAKATAFQGKLFVVSSFVENDQLAYRTYVYNPATNAWQTRAAPPDAGAITRVTLGGKAHVLAVSGTGDEFSDLIPSQLYTP
jgi:N-acetylneuraminic acid mutarotase